MNAVTPTHASGMLVSSERPAGLPARGYPADNYGSAFEGQAGGLRINLLEYWRIILKRRWIAIGLVIASVTLVMGVTLLTTPKYTAMATVQIDRQSIQITKSDSVLPTQEDSDFILTQYELLKSRALAEKVVSALNLGSDPNFIGAPRRSVFSMVSHLFSRKPAGAPAAAGNADAAVGLLMANMTIDPVRATRLVRVSFRSPNPAVAQKVANAIADGFIASNLDRRVSANSYAKTFLQDQLQQMRTKVEDSERKLVDFAQMEQIVSVGQGGSLADSNLAIINKTLTEIIGKRIEAEQIWHQAEGAKGLALPQLANNPIVQKRLQDRAQLEADYQDKLGTFKPSYPSMLQLKARIDEIDRQLKADTQLVKEQLRSSYTVLLSQEKSIGAQVQELKGETLDLQKRGIQYGILKREVDTNRSIYDGLLQRYKEIGITGGIGTNNLSIVDMAQLPGSPSSPRKMLNLGLALVGGLVAGIAAALVTEALDNSVKSMEDLEHATKAVTLGVIPRPPAGALLVDSMKDLRSSLSEAYRSLCTNLQFSTSSGVPTTLLVTSARPSEGKSLTSRTIATHFAEMGFHTLLVDCDLRKPSQHKSLGMDNGVGLSNYLTGGCEVGAAVQQQPGSKLKVMLSGPLPPNPSQLLGSKSFLSLLAMAGDSYDLIVLDGPPVMGLADAPLISSMVSGTLLVAAAGETNAAAVRGAYKRLQFARATLIGTVLTKFDSRQAGYGYGYGYGQDDYYSYGGKDSTPAIGQAS